MFVIIFSGREGARKVQYEGIHNILRLSESVVVVA